MAFNRTNQVTKRAHSNPCFWTALWNNEYFELYCRNATLPEARKQPIFSINVKSDKIIKTTVGNVHFDKKLGLDKVTPERLKRYAKESYSTAEYQEFVRVIDQDPVSITLDFENQYKIAEEKLGYPTLMDVAKRNTIKPDDLLQLATFIVFHILRSPSQLYAFLERCRKRIERFSSCIHN